MGVRAPGFGVLLALCVSASAEAQTVVEPETVGLSSQKLALVRDALKLHIDNGQIPGGIVLVERNGKVVLLDAQGKTPSGQPLTTDTVFGIASLTKPVTAVAVLMFVDDGKIDLDDPVSKYIPEFGAARRVRMLEARLAAAAVLAVARSSCRSPRKVGPPEYEIVPAEKPITVRMLLDSHLGHSDFRRAERRLPSQTKPGETLADVIPRMASALLEFQPGSRWAYSNGAGYEVLGRIVEVASGQPFNVLSEAAPARSARHERHRLRRAQRRHRPGHAFLPYGANPRRRERHVLQRRRGAVVHRQRLRALCADADSRRHGQWPRVPEA